MRETKFYHLLPWDNNALLLSAFDGSEHLWLLIPPVRSYLKRVASALRRDSNTHSQESLTDLVDPYLFPYAFGKTKTL